MTILEKKSNRKKLSILSLVKKGEYSAGYALILVEELSDNGKLTDTDYEELAEYLEELLNKENKPVEVVEPVEEVTETNVGDMSTEEINEPISEENSEQLDTEVNSNEQNDTETVEENNESEE